jgi:hypothetical protein
MAIQFDGNGQWTDGSRPSVRNQKKLTHQNKQTETQKTLGVIHLKELKFNQIYKPGWAFIANG